MIELKTYKMVDEKYCTDCVCVIPSEVYLKKDADAAIAELKQKLEDAGMRERRLKRALWPARAERAMAESYSVLNDVPTSNRWVKALNKLNAKAKEYK